MRPREKLLSVIKYVDIYYFYKKEFHRDNIGMNKQGIVCGITNIKNYVKKILKNNRPRNDE